MPGEQATSGGLTSWTTWPPIRRVRRRLAPAAALGQPPRVHAALGQPSRHLIAREVRVPPATWEPSDVDNDLDRANRHCERPSPRTSGFPARSRGKAFRGCRRGSTFLGSQCSRSSRPVLAPELPPRAHRHKDGRTMQLVISILRTAAMPARAPTSCSSGRLLVTAGLAERVSV